MRALLAIIGLASLLAIACEGPRRPDMLAVVVEQFGQAACTSVPLQLIDVRSETIRPGPADRYISIAVAPSGRQIAAGRMNFDLCGADVPDEERTFTVVLVDAETLEVREHRTTAETPAYLHWSPDDRYLAIDELGSVVVYDIEQNREVASVRLESGIMVSRARTYWPSSGEFLLLYLASNEMIGIPRDSDAGQQRWLFDCDGVADGFPRSFARTDSGPEILYSCTPTSRSPGGHQTVALDLATSELGPPHEDRDGLEMEVNQVSEMTSALRTKFPGGKIGWTYYDDSTGRTLVYTSTYSPSSIDLVGALSEGVVKPNDLETVIAIRDLDGSPIYVHVDLRYDDQDFTIGPLVDVAILD